MMQDGSLMAFIFGLQGAYDKAKESAREYFGTPSTTDNVKAGAADAYAKAKVCPLSATLP